MHRQQLQFLHDWLHDKNSKPIIIRGARQVGKSTLVELFAREYKKTLLNVNLERHPELSQIFSDKDPAKVIQQIELLPNMGTINNVFNFVARNVGQKIKYSNISFQDQSSTIKKDLELLSMARII